MSNSKSPNLKSVGILILLSIIWGSSFILIKKALIAFKPVDVGLLRIVLTMLTFIPVIIIKRQEINWKKWKLFLLVGLTGSGLPAVLFAVAQTQVSSSVAGVLNSMTPVFTLIIGFVLFKKKIIKYQVFGIVFGFAGALLLLLGDQSTSLSVNLAYGSLVILATIMYAFNANAINAFFHDTKPIIISAVSFSLLGPASLVYLMFSGFFTDLMTHEHAIYSFSSVLFLAVIGTGICTVIFFKLLQDTDAVFASSVAFIIPIVALFWGIFDGEQLYISQLAGVLAVLIGIYLIKKK